MHNRINFFKRQHKYKEKIEMQGFDVRICLCESSCLCEALLTLKQL